METSDRFYMCRLCLCKDFTLVNIFDEDDESARSVSDVIKDLLSFQISEKDGFPPYVCSTCIDKLSHFKIFKQQCQHSRDAYEREFILEDLPEKEQSPSSLEWVDCGAIKQEQEELIIEDDIIEGESLMSMKVVFADSGDDLDLDLSAQDAQTNDDDDSPRQHKKRKRVILTLRQKVDICRHLENGVSRKVLMDKYKVGSSTLYDIKSQRDRLLKYITDSESDKNANSRKTLRKPNLAELDVALYRWFKEKRSEGVQLTGPLVIRKAKELYRQMKPNRHCIFSTGWLNRFKSRHGIKFDVA